MDSEQRAYRAKQLQDDPFFREIMDGLRDAAIRSWTQSKTDDLKQREFSWMMVKVIEKIEGQLQSAVDDWTLTKAASVRAPE